MSKASSGSPAGASPIAVLRALHQPRLLRCMPGTPKPPPTLSSRICVPDARKPATKPSTGSSAARKSAGSVICEFRCACTVSKENPEADIRSAMCRARPSSSGQPNFADRCFAACAATKLRSRAAKTGRPGLTRSPRRAVAIRPLERRASSVSSSSARSMLMVMPLRAARSSSSARFSGPLKTMSRAAHRAQGMLHLEAGDHIRAHAERMGGAAQGRHVVRLVGEIGPSRRKGVSPCRQEG
jgi:hypothetical protein